MKFLNIRNYYEIACLHNIVAAKITYKYCIHFAVASLILFTDVI